MAFVPHISVRSVNYYKGKIKPRGKTSSIGVLHRLTVFFWISSYIYSPVWSRQAYASSSGWKLQLHFQRYLETALTHTAPCKEAMKGSFSGGFIFKCEADKQTLKQTELQNTSPIQKSEFSVRLYAGDSQSVYGDRVPMPFSLLLCLASKLHNPGRYPQPVTSFTESNKSCDLLCWLQSEGHVCCLVLNQDMLSNKKHSQSSTQGYPHIKKYPTVPNIMSLFYCKNSPNILAESPTYRAWGQL